MDHKMKFLELTSPHPQTKITVRLQTAPYDGVLKSYGSAAC